MSCRAGVAGTNTQPKMLQKKFSSFFLFLFFNPYFDPVNQWVASPKQHIHISNECDPFGANVIFFNYVVADSNTRGMLFLHSNVRQYKELLFHLYFVGKTTKIFILEHLTTVSTTFPWTAA